MGIEETRLLAFEPCETVGAYICSLNSKHYLFIVDHHSKFSVIKQIDGFSADNVIKTRKIIFVEYGLPCKTMSDAGTNFISI